MKIPDDTAYTSDEFQYCSEPDCDLRDDVDYLNNTDGHSNQDLEKLVQSTH
jgi:hypothetical protein